uniref:Uncharacterized protein n=1 Tax=Siphoviridae sp. ctCCX1 TaxID=2823567 RepID=A0A8S5LDE5_9CAUD|nr:MAG TPA: hypothetical protein [Siphoviridae sp. ctCCX1]DAX15658.1 MAG TPA: hypothetical protein [Caudoviricetes sp.]
MGLVSFSFNFKLVTGKRLPTQILLYNKHIANILSFLALKKDTNHDSHSFPFSLIF